MSRMKAVAVGFSMAWQAESRERPDGDVAAGRLAMFRGGSVPKDPTDVHLSCVDVGTRVAR